MNLVKAISKSDTIGSAASTLCLLHCIATPLLFTAQAGLAAHGPHPWWWGVLDLFFLLISFFAVYWSARNTTRDWMRMALWANWLVLTFLIVNEKLHLAEVPEAFVYVAALGLIALHAYNKKYCRCNDTSCCADR